jgi:hypothetical protein
MQQRLIASNRAESWAQIGTAPAEYSKFVQTNAHLSRTVY